jgi:glycosyltransferase involved in cell wall biosynthesis
MSRSSHSYDLVVVSRALGHNGTERHTVDLVNHLVDSGWQIALIQAGIDVQRGIDLVPWGIRKVPGRIDVIDVRLPTKDLSLADARAWWRLLKRIPAKRALLVKTWYFSTDVRFQRVVRKRYPIVYHLEHCFPPEREPRRSRLHYGFVPGIGLWWYQDFWTRWRMSRTADRVLAVSEATRQALLSHALLSEKQVVTCLNGIAVDRWVRNDSAGQRFRKQYGIADHVYLFGTAGRLAPIKGIDLAVRAFALLPKADDRQACLCVVGDGPCRSELEELVEKLGVRDSVVFTGHVDDVSAAYSAMDTFLFPSVAEPFGLALGEAMACGCRVIAAAVDGVLEIVLDPICGDLLSRREPHDWADAMERHRRMPPNERAELGQKIRAFVARTHDQRARLRFLENVLRGLEPGNGNG